MLRDKRASEVFFSPNKGVDEERVSHQANIADGFRGDDPAVSRANYEIGATDVGTVRASRAISRDHVESRERVRSATAILAPVRPARPARPVRPVRPASRPTKIQKHTRPLAPPPPSVALLSGRAVAGCRGSE